jgi:hypothetical protein
MGTSLPLERVRCSHHSLTSAARAGRRGPQGQEEEIPAGGHPAYFSSDIFQAGQDGEDSDLGPITLGPDDNMWFTQSAEPSSAGAGVVLKRLLGHGTASRYVSDRESPAHAGDSRSRGVVMAGSGAAPTMAV